MTRGPGATHASNGVHTAFQDSTPMLLLVGQVARGAAGREGFQELDYRAGVRRPGEVGDAGRLRRAPARDPRPGVLGRDARAGPGPVVVALPEDMLTESADVPDAVPQRPAAASPGAAELERLRELLAGARRPLAIVGEGGWSAQAGADVTAWAQANAVPVAASFRCQDYVDNRSPAYAGHAGLGMDPALARRIAEADVLLAIGGRLGEIPSSGYTLLRSPVPEQRLVHVHPDPDELGAVYEPELGIVSGLGRFAAAARALPPAGAQERAGAARRGPRRLRAQPARGARPPGALQLSAVMAALRERLPEDGILTCGAGNFTVWAHRYYEFTRYPTQLAPRSGSMGYGFPAALAAKAVHPDRPVVCLAGDGDFLMTGPGARHRRAGASSTSSCSSSTTGCTARSACTRSGATPAAWSPPTWSTRTSSPTRAPSAPTARSSSAPRTSRAPSTRRWAAGARRCSSCAWTPRRSRPRQTLSEIRAAAG